ncbi:type III secretion system needle length determinant, SpaN/EivJ family [Escherichia coli]|uniref:SpaN/EivJ family type III secretion system needle length determinant n=1 Tax=Escherichia coli TaxID=562 RepID=UPI003139BE72
MKLNRKKMVMESIIPPCNTGKIPSVTQDSVESLTDFLKKKIKDCGKKTRKGREEERVYGGEHPLPFRYLPPACLLEKAGKGGGQPEALSVVARYFPGQTADGGQVRALLSKRIKEKESGVAREGYPGASGADAGLLPAESAAGEKKEKAEPPGMPAALLVPHPTGMFSGHSPVPLTRSRTETPVPEMAPSFQAPSEMTEKGEALVYRFRTWGREASVCIQPQHGGAMMLQPSDVAVEQRLVAHWPAGQQRHWYLASDEQGARNYYQPNRDNEEET